MKKLLDEKKIEEIRSRLNESEAKIEVNLKVKSSSNQNIDKNEVFEYNLFEPFSDSAMEANFTIEYNYDKNTLIISSHGVKKRLEYRLPHRAFLKLTPKRTVHIDQFFIRFSEHFDTYARATFEMILENLNIDFFYIGGYKEANIDFLKKLLNNMTSSFKMVGIYEIRYILNDFNLVEDYDTKKNVSDSAGDSRGVVISESLKISVEDSEFSSMSKILKWKYILDNAMHLSMEGDINFDKSEKVNYEIVELVHKHFSKTNQLRSKEAAYVNLLNKYSKLVGTKHTDKFILFWGFLLSRHRTNIFLPIGYMVSLIIILLAITCYTGENIMFLLFPGVVLSSESSILAELSGKLYILVWAEQVIIAVLYYELIVMFRKFVKRVG